MSGPLLVASITVLATALSHSVLGEWLIFRHVARFDNIPSIFGSEEWTRRTLRFVWHLEALLSGGIALILWQYAHLGALGAQDRVVVRTIAGTLLACSVLTLAISRGRHPAWFAFLVAAVFSWIGTR